MGLATPLASVLTASTAGLDDPAFDVGLAFARFEAAVGGPSRPTAGCRSPAGLVAEPTTRAMSGQEQQLSAQRKDGSVFPAGISLGHARVGGE